jgi:uncharacterized oxidoreductase
MMLVDPARYGGAEHFRSEVAQLVEYIKSCPRLDSCEEILLPGDPERQLLAKRTAQGICLDDENWNALVKLGEKLGVAA